MPCGTRSSRPEEPSGARGEGGETQGLSPNGAQLPPDSGGLSRLLQESPLLQFIERGTEFALRIHDNRAVPGNRFLERFTGDEQEADAFLPGFHNHLVATVE